MDRVAAEQAVRRALAQQDTNEAVRVVLQAYGHELSTYLVAMVRDETEGRELYAELCEQLLVSLPRFRDGSSVRTYVYAIALNLVRAYRRRVRRAKRDAPVESDDPRLVARTRTETAPYLRTTAKERLAEARSRLRDDELTLLVLRVDRGMSWPEIGEVLGVGTSAAQTAVLRKRYERLVRRLKQWVVGDGDDPSSG